MKYYLQIIGASTLLITIFGIFNVIVANDQPTIPIGKEIEWYEQQIEFYKNNQVHAHNMAQAARGLGYPDTHNIIVTAKEEWTNAQTQVEDLTAKVENFRAEEKARINAWKEEYPVATEIWLYLDNKGYSDYVKAGILGNMMTEAGGQTLNIQVDAYSPGYYGICQWSLQYNPQLQNTDLITQLNYLTSSMEYEFNTFGKNYKKGFNYSTFITILDEKEAALAFAKCYERCSSASYNVRKKNATIAYNYYTTR